MLKVYTLFPLNEYEPQLVRSRERSLVFFPSASKLLYMLICIIQITAGERQQTPCTTLVGQPVPQKQVHHHGERCGYPGLKWFQSAAPLNRSYPQLRPGSEAAKGEHTWRRHIITVVVPPWKPVCDPMAGFDAHVRAGRLIKPTNSN